MGVQGLTTYLHHKHPNVFVKYKLCKTLVVIDGNSLASVLYLRKGNGNPVFGGDYDRYSTTVESFVGLLSKAEVTPIVVFDGAYEPKKVRTLKKRGTATVISLAKVAPSSPYTRFFPLFMRSVIKDKLVELGVTTLQTDFEADNEIAALARKLKCPVMSLDSDFFIFDVLYIPLSTVNFQDCHGGSKAPYISCELYMVDKLLGNFTGLTKSMLPLAAALLGNDYVERGIFKSFLSHVKLGSGRQKESQRLIHGLFKWLSKESFSTAMYNILSWVPRNKRRFFLRKIKSIVRGYTRMTTTLDKYIPNLTAGEEKEEEWVSELERKLNQLSNKDNMVDIQNIEKLCSTQKTSTEIFPGEIFTAVDDNLTLKEEEVDIGEVTEAEDSDSEEIINEESEHEFIEENNDNVIDIPAWVYEMLHKCSLNPCIMTLLTLKTFFFTPLVEDMNEEHAGHSSVPLLNILTCILLGENEEINYYARCGSSYKKFVLLCKLNPKDLMLPKLYEIPRFCIDRRKEIFTSCFAPDVNMDGFPAELSIFFCAIIYWWRNTKAKLRLYMFHALIAMVVAVWLMDCKIGQMRTGKAFEKKYGLVSKTGETDKQNKKFHGVSDCVEVEEDELLRPVKREHCLRIFHSFLPYFQFIERNERKDFARDFAHLTSELQNIMFFAVVMNQILLCPFPHCRPEKFFNGTFLYNFALNLKKRNCPYEYMKTFFSSVPSIFNVFDTLAQAVLSYLPQENTQKVGKKKKKKQRLKKLSELFVTASEGGMEDEFYDENNRFSVLSAV